MGRPECPTGPWTNYRKGFMRTYYHGRVHRYGQKLIREALDEMEDAVHPEDESVRQIGCCLRCGVAVMNVPGCPNNPDKATEVRIGGYWGSTAYDGSDITGQFMWGLLCDGCFFSVEHRLHEGRGPDWPKQSIAT